MRITSWLLYTVSSRRTQINFFILSPFRDSVVDWLVGWSSGPEASGNHRVDGEHEDPASPIGPLDASGTSTVNYIDFGDKFHILLILFFHTLHYIRSLANRPSLPNFNYYIETYRDLIEFCTKPYIRAYIKAHIQGSWNVAVSPRRSRDSWHLWQRSDWRAKANWVVRSARFRSGKVVEYLATSCFVNWSNWSPTNGNMTKGWSITYTNIHLWVMYFTSSCFSLAR